MPFYWMIQFSVISHARFPTRFAVLVALAFAVTGSFALDRIQHRFRARWIPLLAFFFLIVELSPAPVLLTAFDPPKSFRSLAQMEGNVMLTIPFDKGRDNARAAYIVFFQSVHSKKALNGKIAREDPATLQYFFNLPILRNLYAFSLGKNAEDVETDQVVAPALRSFFGIEYLTIYPPFSTQKAVLDYVSTVFPDAQLLANEKDTMIYRLAPMQIQEYRLSGKEKEMPFFLFSNWRVTNAGDPSRIFSRQEAKLLLPVVKKDENVSLQLTFRKIQTREPGTIQLSAGKQILGTFPFRNKLNIVRVNIPGSTLTQAHNLIKLQSMVLSGGKPQWELLSLHLQIL